MGWELLLIAIAIGLGAGLIGGVCGIGGSIVMLPALGLLLGYTLSDGSPDPQRSAHHVYMAAAMLVNVVVAFAASHQHQKTKATLPQINRLLLPSMMVGIVVGVLTSNLFDGKVSKVALAGFLVLVSAWMAFTAVRSLPDHPTEGVRATWGRVGPIALGTGFLAGFLGIGGGIVLVPLLQLIAKVPLRSSIASSASVMRWTSIVGAVLKVATLPTLAVAMEQPVLRAISLGGVMAIGALLGASLGAKLTHALPIRELRLVVAAVLAIAGAKLAGWI